ncbi:MAG: family N-acetyltransferase [Eubacterium sp.]|nr:family N-acetyltransferase [Eubacterium sp.]
MPQLDIREIEKNDLEGLLKLYNQLNNNPVPEIDERVLKIWEDILKDTNQHILVGVIDDKIVTSCVLLIVSNLTRGQRPYGLVENVVTEATYRKKGYASEVLNFAKSIAQQQNCYKIMLMTGSKEDSTLRFYERAGYNRQDKTAFIQWVYS